MTKMTKDEWFKKFDTEFEPAINEFRHSDKTLFGNEDITTEIKFALGTVIRNMFRVKMEIIHTLDDGKTKFLLTDYHMVQFFADDYHDGCLSIGVTQGRKCVCSHVLNISEYTKDSNSTSKLMRVIRYYISVFISMMDIQNNIELITDIAGNKHIHI